MRLSMHGSVLLRRVVTISLFLLLPAVWAAPSFPHLSGRVVDQAAVLSLQAESRLMTMLKAHEASTSNQLVVATIRDLEGLAITEYSHGLARHWALGQKDKNNGVLFLIAPQARKVRIEVGYGLEGVLTDAIAHNIIHSRVLPLFRQGELESGIILGAESILQVIEGTYAPQEAQEEDAIGFAIMVLFLIAFFLMSRRSERIYRNKPGRYGAHRRYGGTYTSGGGFGHGGGFGSGGFSGGGGGFGGGGASGGW